SVRYIRPNDKFPEIRLRFTPAGGYVYGASSERHTSDKDTEKDPVLEAERIIYDSSPGRGTWRGYSEPTVAPTPPYLTNPGAIYAGYRGSGDNEPWVSWGYLDDTCDGTVTVELARKGPPLVAHAYISAGPPTFVPDALPIRTAEDELVQIVLGPEI